MVLTEIWLRKYNEVAIIMCYKVKVFDNIDWKFGSPISPMPLPEEGGKENVLVKMEGNTHTMNLTFLMKNEDINGGVTNTSSHGGAYGGFEDESKTIFEKIQWFSNELGFIGTHLGDKYDITILSSPPSGVLPMTSPTSGNSGAPEFQEVVDNTVLQLTGFVRNISLRTSAGEPATLRCSIEFIEGNLVGGYQNRVPQPVRSFQMLNGDHTSSNNGANPTTKMTYVYQIPRSVGSASLIGYTTAYKVASAPNVSATSTNPATGWVYATPSPTATATVVLLENLTTGTEYSFKVKARNAKGGGEWSRTITKSTT
jgi:hypothetical protein